MRPTVGREIAAYLEIEPEDLELLRRNGHPAGGPSSLRESGGDGPYADDERESEEQTEPSTWMRRSAKHSTSPDESSSTSSSETVEPPTPSGGVREQPTRSARHRPRASNRSGGAWPGERVGTA